MKSSLMSKLLYYICHPILLQGLYEIEASILAKREKMQGIKFEGGR